MCLQTHKRGFENIVLGFTAPRVHINKSSCYVDFYAKDPASGELRRKKFMLPNKLPKREKLRLGSEMAAELSVKLRGGWNPWVDESKVKSYARLEDCIESYLKAIAKSDRKKTINSYTSRITIFREYIASLPNPVEYVYQIDRSFCVNFLDYVYITRKVAPRTRNNYLGWLTTFCNWLQEHGKISENPCEGIKKIREPAKLRQPLTPEMMQTLHKKLRNENPHLLLACVMEYATFIRPTELSWVRIGDISLKDQTIFVSGEHSKNHRDAFVPVPQFVLQMMIDSHIFAYPDSFYLFSHGLRPGDEHLGGDIFNKEWVKFRKRMKWAECYQFYSLKDTGILDLANSCGIVTARNQARHSDISTTNKYLQGRPNGIPEEIKNFRGAF